MKLRLRVRRWFHTAYHVEWNDGRCMGCKEKWPCAPQQRFEAALALYERDRRAELQPRAEDD